MKSQYSKRHNMFRELFVNSWLPPKAFAIAAGLMFVAQAGKPHSWDAQNIAGTLAAIVMGGVFWGAVGTYLYRKFKK